MLYIAIVTAKDSFRFSITLTCKHIKERMIKTYKDYFCFRYPCLFYLVQRYDFYIKLQNF